MLRKVAAVAFREFCATVLTKGFILGIVMTPLTIGIAILGVIFLMRQGGPQVEGTVAIIDRSGLVAPFAQKRFSPEADKQEAEQGREEAKAQVGAMGKQNPMMAGNGNAQMAEQIAAEAAAQSIKKAAAVGVDMLPADADAEKEKEVLKTVDIHARAKDKAAPLPRVMLAVIPEQTLKPKIELDAATKQPTETYEKFQVFIAPKLDFEIRQRLERKVADAIVDARIQNDTRLAGTGLSTGTIRGILERPEATRTDVTAGGEKKSVGEAQMFVPMGFLILMFMAIMVSGQSLLTSTVEEKSNRIMEVLLSAVSPMQLMVGKVVGQMAVGVLILLLYSSAGIAGLIVAAMQNAIDPVKLAYTVVYFFIAYFTVASLLAAVGAAVNEMREAQTLQTPIMMIVVLPWLLWMPISRAPNSVLAQVLSFFPGAGPFVMTLRMHGSEPVPDWQMPATVLVGAFWALGSAWVAAKVFRIGILMYGKPPNFATLVKWARMA